MVMAHGMKAKPGDGGSPKTGIGSRRIFPPQFKLQVLDSYRHDADCKGNQRATARKYGIHRRQIQKWLQAEGNLRNSVVTATNNNNNCVLVNNNNNGKNTTPKGGDHQASMAVVALESVPAAATMALSPAMPDPASPADIASPTRAHAHQPHMPMDLSVRRPSSATAPATTPSLPTPWPVAVPSRSPSPHSRARSRSRSPLTARTSSVIMTPPWDLSKKIKMDEHAQTTKPLFKPYLLDDVDDKHQQPPAVNNYYAASTYYTYVSYEANVDVRYVFDESGVLQPTYLRPLSFNTAQAPHTPHQRQSYPLDFKLRAIDSYYRDDVCKGNQRAVACKHNIHRRQVQKWLKQEDELRERIA